MDHLIPVFWLSLALGLYPYVGYPVLVWVVSRIWQRPVRRDARSRASVTIVIAAHNEAENIESTIRNKLDQEYPQDLIDVLVVSDGSTDGTDEIVTRISTQEPRVRLIRQEPRQGKTAALNLAVSESAGDLLVFSDANSIYRPDSISRLVSNFADTTVGYVTGKMLYANPDGSLVGDGCTAYMRHEHALWSWETMIGSIVGVDGGIDCVRRRLYRPMKVDQLPDFFLSLDVIEQGYRTVYDEGAVVIEEALKSDESEQQMRVRVALRGLWTLWDKRQLFNVYRYPVFSLQLGSHKLLRYLSPAPLLLAGIANWYLVSCGFVYVMLAAAQVAFFVLVAARPMGIAGLSDTRASRYCFYFLLLNWASAKAAWLFARGQKIVVWEPRVG